MPDAPTPDNGPVVREREAAQRLGFAPRSPSPDVRRLIAQGRLKRAHVRMTGEPTWPRADFEDECARLWSAHHAWVRTFDPAAVQHSQADEG